MNRRLSSARSNIHFDFSETDLIKLEQQYRRSEETKRAYVEKTKALISRDTREIQRLQDEREKLLRSVRFSSNSSTSWTDASLVQDLGVMLACGDRIDEELEAERGQVASLKDQILEWELKFAGLKTGGGNTRGKCDTRSLLKNTSVIENKLFRGWTCFNEMMIRNGELREELKTLQLEKKQFLNVQSRLQKELQSLRKDISNLMTKCTEAFNVRVKTQEKQGILREQSDAGVALYTKERMNMERELSSYCKVEVFLNIKAIVRASPDNEHREVETGKQLENLGLVDFEEAMKTIFGETGENNLEKLLENFIEREEQNYSLLKFVSYQQNEAETIRRQISQLCCEREKFVAKKQQQQEQHRALLMRVTIKQEVAEQQLAIYQGRLEVMEMLLVQLKEGIASLLQISHDSSVSEGVKEENLREYLRMVEDRVNELLTLQSYLNFQEDLGQWDNDSFTAMAGQLLGISPQAVNLPTAAATPAPDDNPDLVESVLLEARDPVSKEDLLTLVNKRIQRRTRRQPKEISLS